MDRRDFLLTAVATTVLSGSVWHQASAAKPPRGGTSPYGDLRGPDANGIRLPRGFTSRVVARSGQPVTGSTYAWHDAPDGGAVFADGLGWIYVSNSEISGTGGGAGALRFGADGAVLGGHRILGGTARNCAGGATPWGTWLSCEEVANGRVLECDPRGVSAAVSRPAMGLFMHEAAAADPVQQVVYLTEDQPDGCFYRFRPDAWGDLSSGTLEVLVGTGTGDMTWSAVPDPAGTVAATRNQVVGAHRFNGGEGCWYADGSCWFTTKGDNRVWRYDTLLGRLSVLYAGSGTLNGVDNITGSAARDLYVAEDGGNMEINLISREGVVAPFLRVDGQSGSELTGPAFSPDGSRLYFSSQRGTTGQATGGITYEVKGRFRA